MNLGYFVKLLGFQLVVLLDLGLCAPKDNPGFKEAKEGDVRFHPKSKATAEGGAYGVFMERFRPALVAQVENSAPQGFNSLMKLNVTLGRQTRQKDSKGTEFYAVLPDENVLLSGSLLRRGAEEDPKVVCSKSKGKTTCRIGRFTFIINNGEQNFPEESIKKLVGLMYRRSQMEDKLAEDSAKVYKSDESAAAEEERGKKSDSRTQSVTVDCSVIPESTSNQTATLECEWNILGLKKRYLVSGENVAELNPLEKAADVRCNNNLFVHSTPIHVRGFGPECVCSTESCIWHLTYPCPAKCSTPVTSCCEKCNEEDLCCDEKTATGVATPVPGAPAHGAHGGAASGHGGHGAPTKGPASAKEQLPKGAKVGASSAGGLPPKKPGKVRYERKKRHVRHHHH